MNEKLKSYLCAFAVAAVAALGAAGGADAVEIETHGYGHQGFLASGGNTYLGADGSGTWEYNALALVFAARADERTTIWMQVFATHEETFRIDWAFVDRAVGGGLSARAGQIKLPMGLYNEIRDAKFLHLSTLEPSMYSETGEMIPEAFRGISLVYDRDLGDSSAGIEVYGGQKAQFEEAPEHEEKNVVGGRITYRPPIEGLAVHASAYNAGVEDSATGEEGNESVLLASVDYAAKGADLKAEYAQKEVLGEALYSYYAQAGYTLMGAFTPFIRYDYITTDKDNEDDPGAYQKTSTIGLGYRLTANVALKAEEHFISGYALPAASGEAASGASEDWNLFVASINFMF